MWELAPYPNCFGSAPCHYSEARQGEQQSEKMKMWMDTAAGSSAIPHMEL